MKKLLVMLALGALASCGGTETYDTQDSLATADSIQSAQTDAVDSAANMQKNNIDSMRQTDTTAIDSAAADF